MPADECATSPVIILGMHRSATSLICTLLERAGLFLGARQDPNRESVYFLELNRWLLRASAATWDYPEKFQDLVENAEVRAATGRYLSHLLGSPRIIGYLGMRRFLRYRSVGRLDHPWGWKDPRNSFTLPLWLDLFPNARIIHVKRHGVDVAKSLQLREQQVLAKSIRADEWRRKTKLYSIYPKRDGFVGSLRCLTLAGAFSFWESVVSHEERLVRSLGTRAISVRCEDLFGSPAVLNELVQFAGLQADRHTLEAMLSTIDRRRLFAFRDDPVLRAFAQEHAVTLAHRGYQSS